MKNSMGSIISLCLALSLVIISAQAFAVTIEPHLASTAEELRAERLFSQLKCPICEGQSLAESDATLALQMRREIRAMVARNMSDDAILLYFSDRYGASILLSPPLNASTLILWLTPLLLITGCAIIATLQTRKKART